MDKRFWHRDSNGTDGTPKRDSMPSVYEDIIRPCLKKYEEARRDKGETEKQKALDQQAGENASKGPGQGRTKPQDKRLIENPSWMDS